MGGKHLHTAAAISETNVNLSNVNDQYVERFIFFVGSLVKIHRINNG